MSSAIYDDDLASISTTYSNNEYSPSFAQGDYMDIEECLTMQGVFGDPEVAIDHGMDLHDLLDAVDFPGYACTSFIVIIMRFSLNFV